MSRTCLLGALVIMGVALWACGDDGDEAPPTATADAAPTPDTATGIAAVDRVLTVVRNADPIAFEALLRPQSIPCTNRFGAGGPPKCFNAPGEPPEGTPVVAFPYSTCELEWQYDLTAFTERFLPRITELYAVVAVEPVNPPPELAAGAYAIVYPDATGFATGHALIVTNDGVVAVDSTCGGTPEIFLQDGPPFYGPEVILEGPAFEPPADDATGIEPVDRVLAAVASSDPAAFMALLRPQTLPCSTAAGVGGPPPCSGAPSAPPEGTPVDAFPHYTCELEWQFDLTGFSERMLERINELYAVVRVDPVTPPEELAEGAYAIIYPDATGFETAHALIVTDDGILAVDTSCGGTAEIFLQDGPPFYGPDVILEGPAFE